MNETTVTNAVVEEPGFQGPKWLVELIARIKVVISKLLLKFGIKWGLI
ncbi:MAG: hypothetical protein NC177_17025 [Ruminococcus flavefaciens]|nr:hypothetical protein [Ruminococcus flavefaciens]